MASLFDRLGKELETLGKRAQVALDEGKLQLELLRLRRQQDNAARDLGLLYYGRERGRDTDPRRIDALIVRLDDLEQAIRRQEAAIAAVKGEDVSVHDKPAPPAQTAEAEVTPAGP